MSSSAKEKKVQRLRSQLYMSDSEYDVDDLVVEGGERTFRHVAKVDYNENKKQPRHILIRGKKRGRPRKIDTLPKRGRGRGRPPKHPELPTTHRKRGRPRKKVISLNDDSIESRIRSVIHNKTNIKANGIIDKPKIRRALDLNDKRDGQEPEIHEIKNISEINDKDNAKVKRKEIEKSSRKPLSEFQARMLNGTREKFLDELIKTQFADKISSISYKVNSYPPEKDGKEGSSLRQRRMELVTSDQKPQQQFDLSFLNTEDPEKLAQYKSVLASQYYKLSKGFAECEEARIDELIRVIDETVSKVKSDFMKYRTTVKHNKKRFELANQLDQPHPGKVLTEMIGKMRLPNRMQKILYPQVFEKLLKPRYKQIKELKENIQYRLKMIDRVSRGNRRIIKQRYITALQENRGNVQQQILTDYDELNREFAEDTGIKFVSSDKDIPMHKEDDEISNARKFITSEGKEIEGLESLAEASTIILKHRNESGSGK